MKQTFFRLLLTGIIISAFATAFSPKPLPPQTVQPIQTNRLTPMKPVTTSFIWFYDQILTIPTGSICDIGTEIGRLNNLFPANVFTTQFSTNVHEYEWGYSLLQPCAIIYSDR